MLARVLNRILYTTYSELTSTIGQFMQDIYPPCNADHTRWGYAKDVHHNESSVYATEANRIKLYAEWRRYWLKHTLLQDIQDYAQLLNVDICRHIETFRKNLKPELEDLHV